jgi:hypothetical protein
VENIQSPRRACSNTYKVTKRTSRHFSLGECFLTIKEEASFVVLVFKTDIYADELAKL